MACCTYEAAGACLIYLSTSTGVLTGVHLIRLSVLFVCNIRVIF